MPKMKFKITLLKSGKVVHTIEGFKEVDTQSISTEEMQDIIVLEQVIEKFTGYRAHVDTEFINDLVESSVTRFSKRARLEKYGATDENDL